METLSMKRERLEAEHQYCMYAEQGACLTASLLLPAVGLDDPDYSLHSRNITLSFSSSCVGSFTASAMTLPPSEARKLAAMLLGAARVLDSGEELTQCA